MSTEDTHLRTWNDETASSPSEQSWLAWIADAEQRAGHSLDGDQAIDGYSMDFAYDSWQRGETTTVYLRSFQNTLAGVKAAV